MLRSYVRPYERSISTRHHYRKAAFTGGLRREHALCYIDLDFFKAINDGAGHAAGDQVLVRIARLLQRSCRASDFAGRIGGDEFILLLIDCPLENAVSVCQKIVDQVAAEEFSFGGRTYLVGASIGITSINHRQPSTLELTTEADAACYVAKSQGRGCVAVFPSQQTLPQRSLRA